MIEIDARDKILGRLATQVAIILMGKDKPSYKPNQLSGDEVKVYNIEKIIITGRKLENKSFARHSGYPGGLKQENLSELWQKNPELVFRQAVKGMLPKNKLSRIWLSRLVCVKGASHGQK